MSLFKSTGVFRYFRQDDTFKLIVEIDQQISEYYRSMIPKWIRVNPQRYRAHISVVRKQVPPNLEMWGKYEGDSVDFYYENIIREGEVYFWLNVFCKRLERVRTELGLDIHSRYTLPPEGFNHCFHTTIGNKKNV